MGPGSVTDHCAPYAFTTVPVEDTAVIPIGPVQWQFEIGRLECPF